MFEKLAQILLKKRAKRNKISDHYKSGFTLAEILITLGIVGVIAALSIPMLITEIDKKVAVTRLQKSLSLINSAYRLSYNDLGELPPDEATALGNKKYTKLYWAPHISAYRYCDTYQKCGYKSNTPFKTISGKNPSNPLLLVHRSRATFATVENFLFIIINQRFALTGTAFTDSRTVVIDINGSQNPNRYGRDVFVFLMLGGDNGIVPMGFNKTDAEIKSGCSASNHNSPVDRGYCAEWIRRNNWKIPRDYPW
jgi:prepilin-type N-terminal cleavage/methylation domain-containing protein